MIAFRELIRGVLDLLRTTSFVSAAVFLISVVAAQAQAGEPSVNELTSRARHAHDAGRPEEAIDAYGRAYQLSGDANLLFELARTHRQAGHNDDAIRLFQTYLRRDPQGTHIDVASEEIKELQQQAPAAPHIVAVVAPVESGAAKAANAQKKDACGAASQASERLEHEGKLREARARLAACLVPGCASQVKQECERRLTAIDAALPAVVLVAQDEASNNLTTVRVSMDGQALVDRLDGSAISVDPGEHRFAFEAVGFRRIETTVVARERNKKIRVLAFLSPIGTRGSGTPEAAGASTNFVAASAPVEGPESSFARGWRRKVGLGLGGAGIASLAVGAIWAIKAKRTYDHALTSECDGDLNRCSPQGVADGQAAHHQATIATVGFVAAGALLATAAGLYFTAPTETRVAVAPTVDSGNGGGNGGFLTVVGKW